MLLDFHNNINARALIVYQIACQTCLMLFVVFYYAEKTIYYKKQ